MATIVTRAGKGAPLTHNEVDANFTNLNADKIETGGALGTPASGNLINCTFPASVLETADIGVSVQAYDADLTAWAGVATAAKQDTLVSATNIKTINGNSLLGAGDLVITPLSDGDKGDITVSASGAAFTIDNGVVSTSKLGVDITTAGKALLDDADASAQRATLGLGTAATTASTAYATSAQGATADTALQPASIGTSVQAYDSNLTSFVGVFALPTADGTINQILKTDGAGNIGFATASGSGTVTSVDMTVPTGLAVTGNPITTSGALAVTYASGYAIPTTTKQADWDSAYNQRLQWDGGATNLVASTGRASLLPTYTSNAGKVLAVNAGATDVEYITVGGTGTVTSVSALTLGTSGTDLSSSVANSTTTPVITLNVPTASASNRGVLSSADWTTFNSKGSGTVTSVSWTGGIVTVATGTTTPAFTIAGTSGGIPYFSSGTAWATSAALAANALVIGGGAGVAPATITTGANIVTALGVSLNNATGGLVTADGTVTLANKTLTTPVISSISNTGTLTLPTSTDTLVGRATTDTLTNKRITARVSTTTSSATPTINTDNIDQFGLTAQAVDITSFTTNLSGTPTDGQKLWIYIVGTAARAITWGAKFESSTVTLPTTTVLTNRLDVGFVWNAVSLTWRCVATA